MASRSSGVVLRTIGSDWRPISSAPSARNGMRLAVGCGARETVAVVRDPAIDGVLEPPDTGHAVDEQRQPGAEAHRQRSVDRLRAAVHGTGFVQPPRHVVKM